MRHCVAVIDEERESNRGEVMTNGLCWVVVWMCSGGGMFDFVFIGWKGKSGSDSM